MRRDLLSGTRELVPATYWADHGAHAPEAPLDLRAITPRRTTPEGFEAALLRLDPSHRWRWRFYDWEPDLAKLLGGEARSEEADGEASPPSPIATG